MPDHNPADDLKAPAGKPARNTEGVITNITERRQEMLQRMAKDEEDLGPIPPEQAAGPSGANKDSYKEDVRHREAQENDNGLP